VLSAGGDGTVRLWPAEDTNESLILSGDEGEVWARSFSSDGMRVVSAGEDGTVRLWPADGIGEPLILSGHEGGVTAESRREASGRCHRQDRRRIDGEPPPAKIATGSRWLGPRGFGRQGKVAETLDFRA
jgi:WD domain, G-beta repeat